MPSLLAVIPARGGSKALPRKNLALLAGRPLIEWTIDAAISSRAVTRVVVSTDDGEIASAARRCGAEVPFMRPADLAEDTTPGIDVVLHAVRCLEQREAYAPDLVMHLQPTSPLRTADDIDAAVDLLAARRAEAVVSVTAVTHHPYWTKTIGPDGFMSDFVQQRQMVTARQALPPVYALNGAIYLAPRPVLVATGGWYTPRTAAYVMPAERSIDVDTAWDLAMAEAVLAAGLRA